MRLSRAWVIAAKDLTIFTQKKGILFSVIAFQLFVSVGLPFLVKIIASKGGPAVIILPRLIDAFSVWFIIGAALLPVTIASYSLIGEKLQKSLEPLLATPVTDGEILLGKAIAAFLPAIAATYLGAIIFMILVDTFSSGVLQHLIYPNWTIGVILLLVAPLACVLSIEFNVLISSRANDVRSAQQFGALILMPFAAIYLLTEIGVIALTVTNLLLFAALILVVSSLMTFLVRSTFQREEILTHWKGM